MGAGVRFNPRGSDMKVRNGSENFFKARRLRTGRIGAAIVAGVAMIALTAMSPAVAHAVPVGPIVTLTPISASNPLGAQHTVTAQVTGVCAETTSEIDDDGEGTACTSDADCLALDTGGADEFCDFSGVAGLPIGFLVTGANAQDNNMSGTVGLNGQAIFQYTGANLGTDTIQACLDTQPEGDDTTTGGCLFDASNLTAEDVASNQVTKTWLEVFGTVVLSPLTAVNPDNPAPASHTVNAQVTGVRRCAGGGLGNNDGTLCSNDTYCTGGDTCSDKSGVTVGFEILSGPNAGDKGFTTTDGNGVASLTYTSNGVAGVDTIQACLDGDAGAGSDENTPSVSECLTDAAANTESDFASNTVTKRWDPTLTLENFDAVFSTYSTAPAFNPVGTTHTVRATIVGASTICFGGTGNHRNACTSNNDCSDGDTCGIAGYPVWFGVLAGSQNAGDLPGSVDTDSNGVATKTYTDTAGAGVDTIQACVDADVTEGIPDDASFSGCLADYPGQADVPSNTVSKTWLSRFVTGGGKWTKLAAWDSFGGVVGQKPGTTTIAGEWQETAHAAKGGNVSCHWNTFPALNFSCVSGKCGTNLVDTVNFIAANGTCTKGTPSQTVTVTITDGFKKPDLIKVTGGTGAGSALNVNPPVALGTGNFTLHP